MSLTGRTIALAEGRQLDDLIALLEKEGAVPFPCPLLSILDPSDDRPALRWLDLLIADRFGWIVLFTGEGVRRLLACAERHGKRDAVVAAFARSRTVTRGPKPVRALAEVQIKPTRVAASPTTDGVIAALANEALVGLTVGVQMYSEENPPMIQFLRAKGANVEAVLPYVYAPASDIDRVTDLIHRMHHGTIDAIAFTSSPQVDRLFEVADERQITNELRSGLVQTKVAVVGPIVADNLYDRGVRVDVCPEHGWVMKNLVQKLKSAWE